MINLHHIKVKQCPHCHCTTVVKEEILTTFDNKIAIHTNGQRRERQKFLCGYELEWSPNFNATKTVDHCRESNEYIDHVNNTIKAKIEELNKEINNLKMGLLTKEK